MHCDEAKWVNDIANRCISFLPLAPSPFVFVGTTVVLLSRSGRGRNPLSSIPGKRGL